MREMKPEQVSAAAAIAAFVITALIALANVRTANAAKRATESADRSAAAAERSAKAAEQAVEQAMRVRWRLTSHGGSEYLLTNDGGSAAYDVRLECGALIRSDSPWRSIGPGEAVTFHAALTYGSSADDHMVTVSHRREHEQTGDGALHWRHPLPAARE